MRYLLNNTKESLITLRSPRHQGLDKTMYQTRTRRTFQKSSSTLYSFLNNVY
jgi:hypothetical protein